MRYVTCPKCGRAYDADRAIKGGIPEGGKEVSCKCGMLFYAVPKTTDTWPPKGYQVLQPKDVDDVKDQDVKSRKTLHALGLTVGVILSCFLGSVIAYDAFSLTLPYFVWVAFTGYVLSIAQESWIKADL